jgi:type II secretory pathway pseudopilin PulG
VAASYITEDPVAATLPVLPVPPSPTPLQRADPELVSVLATSTPEIESLCRFSPFEFSKTSLDSSCDHFSFQRQFSEMTVLNTLDLDVSRQDEEQAGIVGTLPKRKDDPATANLSEDASPFSIHRVSLSPESSQYWVNSASSSSDSERQRTPLDDISKSLSTVRLSPIRRSSTLNSSPRRNHLSVSPVRGPSQRQLAKPTLHRRISYDKLPSPAEIARLQVGCGQVSPPPKFAMRSRAVSVSQLSSASSNTNGIKSNHQRRHRRNTTIIVLSMLLALVCPVLGLDIGQMVDTRLDSAGLRVARQAQRQFQLLSDAVSDEKLDGRSLQDTGNCTPVSLYDGDNSTLATFAPQFEPICACQVNEPDPSGFLANFSGSPLLADQFAFLQDFNDYLNSSSYTEENACITSCALCYDGYCAYKETRELLQFEFGLSVPLFPPDLSALSNATEEEINSFADQRVVLEEFVYSTRDCYEFVVGPETGVVCISLVVTAVFNPPLSLAQSGDSFDPLSNGTQSCNITINGNECNSCTYTSTTAGACVSADCTNIIPEARPDSCAADPASTFIGLLEPVYTFDAQADDFADLIEEGNVTANCVIVPAPPSASPPYFFIGRMMFDVALVVGVATIMSL